jgi:alpha-tubulin suppressor-like RCC1 family protein
MVGAMEDTSAAYTAGVAAVRWSGATSMMSLAITDAVQVTAGGEHTCVRRTGGTVTCWGRDNVGQLGDGTQGGDRGHGLDVSGLSATQVEAGTLHTCAVRADQTVQCWGDNASGALGDGSTSDNDQPVDVSGLSDAVQVSAGNLFTCAVRTGGGVSCWGENGNSQVGDATTMDRTTPRLATVVMGTVALEVSAGGTHACARSAGNVVCWGDTAGGRLGAMPMATATFATVPGLSGALSVAAGLDVSCAALGTSGVRCWGANGAGQLGDGTTMMRMGPVAVVGLPPSP